MKKTLSEYLTIAQQLENEIIANQGELTEELIVKITENEIAQKDKVDGYYYMMDRLEDMSAFYKRKADEFNRIKKALDNTHDKIKDRLKHLMTNSNTHLLEGNDYAFRLTQLKDKLIINEEDLRFDYKKQEISYVIDKVKIENDLADGKLVNGVKKESVYALRPIIKKLLKDK